MNEHPHSLLQVKEKSKRMQQRSSVLLISTEASDEVVFASRNTLRA